MRRRTALGAGALALGALVAAGLAARRAQLEPMLVEGGSMRPTLTPGQRIAVAPLVRPPTRGDLVVVTRPRFTGAPPRGSPDPSRSTGAPLRGSPDPSGRDLEVVKRVVGLPGERVRLHPGGLEVDGQPVPEPYLAGPPAAGTLEVELGPAEYLVLGDHRAASTDGRDFGPVGADALVGRVRFAYWPPRTLGGRGGSELPSHGSRTADDNLRDKRNAPAD
jgi:signal peptidase I